MTAWTPLPVSPLGGRALADAAAGCGRVVLWGGTEAAGPAGWRRDGAVLELATGAWSPVPAAPLVPRRGTAIAAVAEGFVIWGGTTRDAIGRRQLADGAIYSWAARSWRALRPAPLEPRTSADAVAFGGLVVVWGGRRDGDELADGAVLDVEPGAWRRVEPPVELLPGAPAARWGDRLVLVAADLRLLAYDPVGRAWEHGDRAPASFGAAELAWWSDGLFARFGDGRCARWRFGGPEVEEEPFPVAGDYEYGWRATGSGVVWLVNGRRPDASRRELLACHWRPALGWDVEQVGLAFRRASALAVSDGRVVVWGGLGWPVEPGRPRYFGDGAVSPRL